MKNNKCLQLRQQFLTFCVQVIGFGSVHLLAATNGIMNQSKLSGNCLAQFSQKQRRILLVMDENIFALLKLTRVICFASLGRKVCGINQMWS